MKKNEIIKYSTVIKVELKNKRVLFIPAPKDKNWKEFEKSVILKNFSQQLNENKFIVIWWVWVNIFNIDSFEIDKWDLSYLTLSKSQKAKVDEMIENRKMNLNLKKVSEEIIQWFVKKVLENK